MEPMNQNDVEYDEAMSMLADLERRIAKLEQLNHIEKSKKNALKLSVMVFEYLIKDINVNFSSLSSFLDAMGNKKCDLEEGLITSQEFNDWCEHNSPQQININDLYSIISYSNDVSYDAFPYTFDVKSQQQFLLFCESFQWASYVEILGHLTEELKSIKLYAIHNIFD